MKKSKPIVYSCSGCSTAAQTANYIAIQLDRKDVAEMSCIAGVGGGVKSLVQKAKLAENIVALDGCPLRCVQQCLAKQGLKPNLHLVLTEMGVKKLQHEDFNKEQAEEILNQTVTLIANQKR
jgi:uncharacterized metal-binding protein